MSERIQCAGGFELAVDKTRTGSVIDLRLSTTAPRKCRLHWGLVRWPGERWSRPPESYWP